MIVFQELWTKEMKEIGAAKVVWCCGRKETCKVKDVQSSIRSSMDLDIKGPVHKLRKTTRSEAIQRGWKQTERQTWTGCESFFCTVCPAMLSLLQTLFIFSCTSSDVLMVFLMSDQPDRSLVCDLVEKRRKKRKRKRTHPASPLPYRCSPLAIGRMLMAVRREPK